MSLPAQTCAACGASFTPAYAYQRIAMGSAVRWVCSEGCRAQLAASLKGPSAKPVYKLAILNQKGGTGKTTSSVNIAAGMAAAGKRVLLIDADSQGHVGISLGVSADKGLYHVVVEGADPAACAVRARENLDVLCGDERLASADIFLARMNEGRDRLLKERMATLAGYDIIMVDCGPSLSLLNLNILTYVDAVLVPVSCDYLSLVGVRQILKTIQGVNERLGHPVKILGVLPTFYDTRNKISDEAVQSLRLHFEGRVLDPIRVNTRLKEAPSHKKSIFDYDPDSRGAEDYRRAVKWINARIEPAG